MIQQTFSEKINKFVFTPIDKDKRRWCKNHPTSFWGKDQHGNWYAKCYRGNKTGESCEIGENE